MTDNRAHLRQLIEQAGITQKTAAQMIAAKTGRPLSERAVSAWLADPALPSARACPGWAVTILEGAVRKAGRGK